MTTSNRQPLRTQVLAHRPDIARVLPFALFIALLALRGWLDDSTDTRWLYAVQAGVTALCLLLLWRNYAELRSPTLPMRHVAPWLVSVGAGLGVFCLWIALTSPWMRVGEPSATFAPVGVDGELQWGLIAVRLAGAVLVVPLMEELFWRSFLMRWIDRRDFLSLDPASTSLYALLASSAVFALAHDQWLAGLLAGLVFGALYRHTQQIWHAIAAHAVANLALGVWVIHQRAWSFW